MRSTFTVNTRVYKRKGVSMINKIWVGALVVNVCLVLSSGDIITLTTFTCALVVNISGYIFYKNWR